jgi:8-oxo-dGTP diphosphatase
MKESIMKLVYKLIKQKYVYVGIPVIIQNSRGEILLGKRDAKMITYPNTWGLPGGMPEYGEKLADAAKREVKEEVGIDVEITKLGKIHEYFPNKKCKIHGVDVVHYAKIIKGIPKPKDETSEIRWFKPSEIKNMNLAYDHKEILKEEGLI